MQKNFKSPTNLYTLCKRQALYVVLFLSIFLLTSDVLYVIAEAKMKIDLETIKYETELKAQIVSEVDNAIAVVNAIMEHDSELSWESKKTLSAMTLEKMRLGNMSYYFGADFQGNTVLGPAKGTNVYDIEDKNGLKVVQALIETAQNGGGFVEYTMPPLDGVEQKRKISYVLPVTEFDWYIGAGIDYDVIDQIVSEITANAQQALLEQIGFLLFVIFISIGIAYGLNKKIYSKILQHVDVLIHFIQQGSTKYIKIPVETFKIDEFTVIAKKMQEMMDQRESHELLLEKQAYFDNITELPNRNAFNLELSAELAKCHNKETFGAVVLLDIDHFKITTDTFGHIFGDKVLYHIACRLRENHSDFTSRFGGDEFVFIISDIDSIDVLENRLNVLKNSLRTPIDVENLQLQFNASIGVSIFPKDGDQVDDLLRKADLAMYHSKEQGRNRITFFNSTLLEGNYNFFYYDNKLRQALEDDEFFLQYQPQFDSKTHEIIGLEGLVRWGTKDGQTIMPNSFIPIAEKTGTISLITERIINKACEFSSKINLSRSIHIPISINISSQDLTSTLFVEHLEYWVDHYQIPYCDIVLEITETGLLENFELAVKQMENLIAKGFSFSLDDFGTGYSSLSYVMQLPIDVIKIDKSFIDSLGQNNKSEKMIMIIEDIAKTLSLYSIAEGVETQEQAEILKRLGINALQGYYFSKPMNESDLPPSLFYTS